MKPAASLFAVAIAIVLMWACAAARLTEPEPQEVAPHLTPLMYDPIQIGMSVEEVVRTVGYKPTDKLGSAASGFLLLIWEDGNKSAIRVRFKDGKLFQAECTADISSRVVSARF